LPVQPNTPAVMTAIQGIIQGLVIVGGSGAFFAASSVLIGKAKDIPNLIPLCEITMTDDESMRAILGNGIVQGGVIDDSQLFMIEVTLNMDDSIAVEQQLALIRDALSKAFHASALLGMGGQVQYAGWQQQKGGVLKGAEGYAEREGVWYRIYRRKLYVNYRYNVTIVP
jgi:hypothetical protein